MKKILSILLVFAVMLSSVNVFAFTDNSLMEKVLIEVKSRIDVPIELTEFNASERSKASMDDNGTPIKYFQFEWSDLNYDKYLSVQADADGNITEYNLSWSKLYTFECDISVKKETAFETADSFIKKALPNCFADSKDMYVLDEKSYMESVEFSGNRLSFSFKYNRIIDGYPVYGNEAYIYVSVAESDCIVTSLRSGWDYDAKIIKPDKELIENPREKYLEKFPVELIYQHRYVPYKINADSDKDLPELYYRFKDHNAGYITATDGEVAERTISYYRYISNFKEEAAMDSATGAMAPTLTKEELNKLEEIAGMISDTEAMNIIKSNKHLGVSDELVVKSTGLYKAGRTGDEYIRNIELGYPEDNKSESIYASFDAKTGELISYRRSKYTSDAKYDESLITSEMKSDAQKKLDDFINDVSSDISEYKLLRAEDYTYRTEIVYERYVNGVRYIDNRISAGYDLEEGFISDYSINHNHDLDGIKNPSDAISDTEACDIIFGISPLKLEYIPTKEGYMLCYGCEDGEMSSAMIYAITGEAVYKASKKADISEYSDISGHWCEKEANELLNIGIGFEGGYVNPDEKCSQQELLKLFTSAIQKSNRYMSYTEEDLYYYLEISECVGKDEKNPDSSVVREDAFAYAVRIMGHREIAELSDIYKTSFLDNDLISADKIGCAAILKGFGIVSGDGTYLRPKDEITRAEAIVIAYRLLTQR